MIYVHPKDQLTKTAKETKELEKELTLCHVKAYKLITEKNKNIKIDLIGFHGQTILHRAAKWIYNSNWRF